MSEISTKMQDDDRRRVEAFFEAAPDIERVDLMIVDMNGLLRGKWIPKPAFGKLTSGGVRLPVSTSALDMWGHDVEGSGLGIISGDKDGLVMPVASTLTPMPWAPQPTAQMLASLAKINGAPSAFDPRHRLAEVVQRFSAIGLTPVVATELEFFLFRPGASGPEPATEGSHLYDMTQMEKFDGVLSDIRAVCAAQGIGADVVIAESGVGQYEVNFNHVPDALQAADWAVLFRRLVKGVARNHELDATFMAKPFGEDAGSGMHIHASLLDETGQNALGGSSGEMLMRHAIGGILDSLAELQLVFAPNVNSYRRFQREGFAPTQANWGFDHRAAAVRVPEKIGKGARFEHRVAGADVNPYLAVAATLGAALIGIEAQAEPGPSMDVDESSHRGVLSEDWRQAVARFEASEAATKIFGAEFARVFATVKRDEIRRLNEMVTDVEYETYLERI